ncbi:MAG: amidohydrolase family protein [Solirubrobacterales bacterium]|nr:amidohydrolase family protein [Solirubrobacterales bacterium]
MYTLKRAGAFTIFTMVLVALAGATQASPASKVKDSQAADLVLRNGFVYTVDAKERVKQAVAVDDGRIVFVGSNGKAKQFIGPDTRVVDLRGKMVMPGLMDGHIHELSGGRQLTACSLDYQDLEDDQMRAVIQECLDSTSDQEPDGWLSVEAWLAQSTPDPDKSILDALDTNRPILVTDTHVGLANSRALELAGIDSGTPDPPDGRIGRYPNGEPNGILVDGAVGLVRDLIPQPTFEQDLASLNAAVDALNAEGVTSIMDASADEHTLQLFEALEAQGELTLRADFALRISQAEAFGNQDEAIARVTDLKDRYSDATVTVAPNINTNTIKLVLDGLRTFPTQTGALLEPYYVNIGTEAEPEWVPGDDYGELYIPHNNLFPLVRSLDAAGWQLHMHVVGDRATREGLDAIEFTRNGNGPNDQRHTLVHIDLAHPTDYPRFAELDTIASVSYQWGRRDQFTIDGEQDYMGPERFDRLYPFQSLRQNGAFIAWGSDWPVDPLSEWRSLEIGVTRTNDLTTDPKYTDPLNASEGTDIEDVVHSATAGTAYQLHKEGVLGSIEVGKLADLIVLNQNVLQVPPGEISETKVLETIVGGETVYSR